jgi:DNA-binding MarR family transcriptional regulator
MHGHESMGNEANVSELGHHLGYWLRFVSNHVSYAFKRKVEAKGVTVAEWALMRQMFQAGPVNPSQLADHLGMTRGAISKLIERLLDKSLVDRTSSGKDRRYQSVSLTAKGRRLVPILARLADANDAEMFGHLTARTQAELVELLRGIVHHHRWKDVPVK